MNSLHVCILLWILAVHFASLDLNMTVRSDERVGSQIHGIYIAGGEAEFPGGLNLSTVTQYFYLDERDIRVSTCLPTGLTETLEIRMTGIGSTSCSPGYLHIEVIPTIPALKTSKFADNGPGGLGGLFTAMTPPSVMPQHYEIMVDNCSVDAIVRLFHIEFFNEGECVTFNCSVACTNENKHFWMTQEIDGQDKTINTNLSDIKFNFVYQLNVTCRESGLSADIKDFEAADSFEVAFITACVTAENNTTQAHPNLPTNSDFADNSTMPINELSTSLLTTETIHQNFSLMDHNKVMKSTYPLPKSALTDDASVSILTEPSVSILSEPTLLLSTETPRALLSTAAVFSSPMPTSIEAEYLPININSTVNVSSFIVETSSMTLSASALPGSAFVNTSDFSIYISKDNEKEGTIIVPVVSSMAGVALLSVIGVSVYALVSKRCEIVPLFQKKGKVEDKESTKNANSIDDLEHEHQTTAICHA